MLGFIVSHYCLVTSFLYTCICHVILIIQYCVTVLARRFRRSSSLRRGSSGGSGGGGAPEDAVARRRRHSRRRCNSASPSSSSHAGGEQLIDVSALTAHTADCSGSRTTSTSYSSATSATSDTAYSDPNTGNTSCDVISCDVIISRTGSTELDVVGLRRVTSPRDVSSSSMNEGAAASGKCESASDIKDQYSSLISTWPSATGKPSQDTRVIRSHYKVV